MKAIIVADGDVSAGAATAAELDDQAVVERPLVIAADGGALKAELLGLRPDIVVGDLDSLSPEAVDRLAGEGAEIQRHPYDKNESDTELAVLEAVRRGARQLIVLGALGGRRLDHALANLLLLALPQLAGRDVALVDSSGTVRLLSADGGTPARLELRGRPADLVSLLPLSEVVDGVSTEGLEYPLADEPLRQGPSRGLSNVMLGERATIAIRAGRLAVIHSPRGNPEIDDD